MNSAARSSSSAWTPKNFSCGHFFSLCTAVIGNRMNSPARSSPLSWRSPRDGGEALAEGAAAVVGHGRSMYWKILFFPSVDTSDLFAFLPWTPKILISPTISPMDTLFFPSGHLKSFIFPMHTQYFCPWCPWARRNGCATSAHWNNTDDAGRKWNYFTASMPCQKKFVCCKH